MKINNIIPVMTAVIAMALCAACGSEVKITKPSIDAQIIIERGRNVETEAELRDLERLANEYELAYRQRINGAAAERFKALTGDVLTDAAYNMQEYQSRQEVDMRLRESIDAKLSVLDRAWCLALTTPEEDRRKLEHEEHAIDELEVELAMIASEREDIVAALDEVGYDDPDADEKLELYGNRLDAIDVRSAELIEQRDDMASNVALYRLAYKLQRGEEFTVAAAEPSPCCESSCDEDCM